MSTLMPTAQIGLLKKAHCRPSTGHRRTRLRYPVSTFPAATFTTVRSQQSTPSPAGRCQPALPKPSACVPSILSEWQIPVPVPGAREAPFHGFAGVLLSAIGANVGVPVRQATGVGCVFEEVCQSEILWNTLIFVNYYIFRVDKDTPKQLPTNTWRWPSRPSAKSCPWSNDNRLCGQFHAWPPPLRQRPVLRPAIRYRRWPTNTTAGHPITWRPFTMPHLDRHTAWRRRKSFSKRHRESRVDCDIEIYVFVRMWIAIYFIIMLRRLYMCLEYKYEIQTKYMWYNKK